MKLNVGRADKFVRYILAIIAFVLGYYYQSWWGLLGFVFLITGLINWCPIYKACGVSTFNK